MRVLTIVDDLGPGGTQRAAQNYALGYRRAGHASAVLTLQGGGPREGELVRAGVEVFASPSAGNPGALAAAEAWAPDLLHLHRRGSAEPVSAAALRRLRAGARPAVLETNVFARADYSDDRALIDVHLQLSRWCLWKWSRWTRELRPAPLGVVLPYAVDPGAFYRAPEEGAAFRAAHGIPEDALVLGRVGQPSVWKWHPALLRAFGEVAPRHPRAYLLLVGLPPELRAALDALPDAARRRVVELPFLGGDDALRAGYNAMDAFVHAAQIGESFGMVLAEAMLCECPVVTLSRPARDNSQLEVVGHEVGGLVASNEGALAEAMERLLADAEARRRLGAAGARTIRERFALGTVTESLLRIAEHAVAHRDRAALSRALREDPALVTSVRDEEIEALLARSIGEPVSSERLAMWLVHQPRLYRLWCRLKRA
jgi:glycosyltransferase involved in cell wall biosynthesis